MMARGVTIGRPGQFAEFRRFCIQRVERAVLDATDRAAAQSLREIRTAMQGAGLGRLGNAIGYGSDLKKTGTVHRRGAEGFSASGWLYIRSRSERATGAIEAYTAGAEIRPVRSPWLWIATDEIPRRAGRFRMTPALYVKNGFEDRIGRLVQVPGRHAGEALLIAVQRSRSKKSARFMRMHRLKTGERQNHVIAFVGIRNTSRAARVDARAIMKANVRRISSLVSGTLARPTD